MPTIPRMFRGAFILLARETETGTPVVAHNHLNGRALLSRNATSSYFLQFFWRRPAGQRRLSILRYAGAAPEEQKQHHAASEHPYLLRTIAGIRDGSIGASCTAGFLVFFSPWQDFPIKANIAT